MVVFDSVRIIQIILYILILITILREIEWKKSKEMERGGKRTKKHRVGSAKRGPRSVSETERSDGLPVGAELRHEAGSVMCASAVGETKAEDGNGRGLEGRRKERKKGVDTGNRTADSQLLTWVNGLPTASRCRLRPRRILSFIYYHQSTILIIPSIIDSSNYTRVDFFEDFYFQKISKIYTIRRDLQLFRANAKVAT